MNTKELLRIARVVKKRPSRLVDVLREPRAIVIGGPVANRLGLQVVRTVKDNLAWRTRPARVTPDLKEAVETIERDGIVVMPNYLKADEFERLRAEVALDRPEGHKDSPKRVHFGENFEVRELQLSDWPREYPVAMRALRDDPFLLGLASAISRRRQSYKPHTYVFHVHKPEPEKPHTDLDYNQFTHADRHYQFVKAFFYLNDVGVDNAPYSYARRSHRITPARLRYEYQYSVLFAEIRKRGRYERTFEQLELNRSLAYLAEEYLHSVGTEIEPICAPANTLIVSNNIGFHRRGAMTGTRARTTINMDYKYLESPAQWLFPVLRHLYS